MTIANLQQESLQQAFDRIYNAIAVRASLDLQKTQRWSVSERSSPDSAISPLRHLFECFQLSPFEGDVLTLCAGTELEGRFAKACAAIHGESTKTWPSFGLAFSTLPFAHWSALSPSAPLRRWKLLHMDSSMAMLDSPLRIDEPILHYLLGNPCSDDRIQPFIHPLPSIIGYNSDAHQRLIQQGTSLWSSSCKESRSILLLGSTANDRHWIFQQMCHLSGYAPYALNAADIPASPTEREQLVGAWTREALMLGGALCIRMSDSDNMEVVRNITSFTSNISVPVAIEAREGSALERSEGIRLYLPTIKEQERKALWTESLGPLVQQMNGSFDRLVDSFSLDAVAINSAGVLAKQAAASTVDATPDLAVLTWNVCRTQARRSLDALAHRIEPKATWDDLVLPDLQCQTLRQIVLHVRRRSLIQNEWGFCNKYTRGSAVTALFSGASGTGKTMAAEVIANDLALDLYHIDLASIMSKYIGETEKHLRRIFDAADESGAVLLFDEADALFGRRSEVNDSHDRYANLQVSYLLQRMESYRGIAILTTNMKQALDTAFLRRLRFIIVFPFPDASQRQAIWQHVFPTQTPVTELDYKRLAQLNVPGGIIRNIAIHSAFLAAEEDTSIRMDHILRASRIEYAKIDKPLTATETGGWS
jgi:ATPase family associated with various cellular activities (AAA)